MALTGPARCTECDELIRLCVCRLTPGDMAEVEADPEIPRRNRIDKFTPTEQAIWDASLLVEMAGADVHLTDAVVLLGRARDKVADFVDGVPHEEEPVAPVDLTCPKCSTIHTIEVPCNKEGKERLRQNRIEGLRAASRIAAGMYAGGHEPTIDGKLASAEDMIIILAKPLAKYLEGE